MRTIQNQTFDEERALYGSDGIMVKDSPSTVPLTVRAHLRNAGMCRWSEVSSICVIPSGMTTVFPSETVR